MKLARLLPAVVALLGALLPAQTASAPAAAPIPVKVVVIAMFEQGQDTGDKPGELQYWVERDHLDHVYPLAAGLHPVRMNDQGEMAVLTGAGTAHAAATIMALGLDPRFDFKHTYWIVAGIAGGSPDRISLGSAAWARYVVDADLAYEIDGREIPKDWSTGLLPLGKTVPFEQPADSRPGQLYALSAGLAEWAYDLTRNVKLDDSDKLREARSHFDGAAANKPPFVMLGDEVSSSTFWHGKLMDQWATEWMRYFTEGKGEFATTAMEDTGTLQSLAFLSSAGRIDHHRILVLRTVSNYDRQPRELTAAESLAREKLGTYSGFMNALEADYRVGHVVVEELLKNWDRYGEMSPNMQCKHMRCHED